MIKKRCLYLSFYLGGFAKINKIIFKSLIIFFFQSLLFLFLFYITTYENTVNCFSTRGHNKYLLRDLNYHGIQFKADNSISDREVFVAFECFREAHVNNRLNFGMAKYF